MAEKKYKTIGWDWVGILKKVTSMLELRFQTEFKIYKNWGQTDKIRGPHSDHHIIADCNWRAGILTFMQSLPKLGHRGKWVVQKLVGPGAKLNQCQAFELSAWGRGYGPILESNIMLVETGVEEGRKGVRDASVKVRRLQWQSV